jgi:uncharacterized protein DUF6886
MASIAGLTLPAEGEVLHVSEDPGIAMFVRHVAPSLTEPDAYVWAVDAEQAPSYWFPAPAVLFFGYCMVRGSYVSRTERSRRILLVQMRSPIDRPLNEAHRSPVQGTMLRGINPYAAQI